MAKLNLKAENAGQERILAYLEENASEALTEKINGGYKTMAGCWSYITSRARSLAKNNCAVVEDAEVYGWAVHYFEEEGLNREGSAKNRTVEPQVHEEYTKRREEQNKKLEEEEKRKKEEAVRKEQEKMEELRKRNAEREERVRKKLEEEQLKKSGGIEGQMSLFDLLGGE